MRNGIAAAAFDLDGTLYPNYRLYIRLIPFMLREWRLLWAFGKARDRIREEGERVMPPLRPDFYDYQARLTAGILGADPALISEQIERLIYRGWERHFTRVRLFPHVTETLTALRGAGFKMGLLSDFPPEQKLAALGIGAYWDAVLCTERIGALKPDVRPFQELAAALSTPPEQILYVGNSRRYDVTGAQRAGMKTALITGLLSETGGASGAGTKGPGADFVFHDYRQLLDFMVQLT